MYIYAPLFFLVLPLNLELNTLLLSQKTDLEKNRNRYRFEQIPWSRGTQREPSCKRRKKMAYYLFFYFFPDDFGLRSPVIQKPFYQTKIAISIVARASTGAFVWKPSAQQFFTPVSASCTYVRIGYKKHLEFKTITRVVRPRGPTRDAT